RKLSQFSVFFVRGRRYKCKRCGLRIRRFRQYLGDRVSPAPTCLSGISDESLRRPVCEEEELSQLRRGRVADHRRGTQHPCHQPRFSLSRGNAREPAEPYRRDLRLILGLRPLRGQRIETRTTEPTKIVKNRETRPPQKKQSTN